MPKTHRQNRRRWRRKLLLAAAVAVGLAAASGGPSKAQWFGPNCRSIAQEQLKEIGPQLSQIFAAADRNDPQALLAVGLSGLVGAITLSRPVEITVRSVDATAIERSNVQTRCRVRAPATITYSRPGVWVEDRPGGPRLAEGDRDEALETELTYDFVFAGREILESGLDGTIIVSLLMHASQQRQAEQNSPEVQRLVRAAQLEQQRVSREAQARAENERLLREEQTAQTQRAQQTQANLQRYINQLDQARRRSLERIGRLEEQIASYRREIERLQLPSSSVGSGVDAASDREYRARIRASREREIARITDEIRELQRQVAAIGESRTRAVAEIEREPAPQTVTRETIATMATSAELETIASWTLRCFEDPPASRSASPDAVRVRVRFAPNGALTAAPEPQNAGASEFAQVLARAAVRAVQRCAAEAPLRIPPHRYDAWKDVTITIRRP